MAYIGNKPEVGNFRKCDAITTSATATYNLLVGGVAVNPAQNQVICSLNGVIQSSGDSYTIASSQITFASTLASSDVIDFILILGDTLDVGVPSDDTVSTAKIQTNAVTNAKMSDDAIGVAELSATGTASSSTFLRGDNSWATAGGDNTPSFRATMGSNQSVPASYTKLVFDTETWDTDSAYDHSTNYRFTVPSGAAGKYLFTVFLSQNGTSAEGANYHVVWYKNGSATHYHNANPSYGGNVERFRVSSTITASLSVSDYIEVYCNGSAGNFTVQAGTEWTGFKLAGV